MTGIDKLALQEKFNGLYENKRLLAIQLNGFSHKVFYDSGSRDTRIEVEEYSPWTEMERATDKTKILLSGFSTHYFKGRPQEIVFVHAEDR